MSSSSPRVTKKAKVTRSVKSVISDILEAMPEEWRGTTFKNSNLLGREGFCHNLTALLASGSDITTESLVGLGNAEDYLRVSTNISCTLELALAEERGLDISSVFTFSSTIMPIIAVLMTASVPVHLYTGADRPSPFTLEHLALLGQVNCQLEVHASDAPAGTSSDDRVVLAMMECVEGISNSGIDGVVGPSVLYIHNVERIRPADILVIRKRMTTPITTPAAEAMLQTLAGMTVTADVEEASELSLTEFYAHLQTMSGTPVDTEANPVCFTAGLSATASLWLSMVSRGGADILMASTAYGGSSQLTDLLTARGGLLRKHKFHIQGAGQMINSIREALDGLAAEPDKLLPTTVLFAEIPTNPDMKVPDMNDLASVLNAYGERTGRRVLVVADTTFAPASGVMTKLRASAPELDVMCFISMSKSVSRGRTTAGAIIANHTAVSKEVLGEVRRMAEMLDTGAKRDQLVLLTANHVGVEERCAAAYAVAVGAGTTLQTAVKKATRGVEMPLAFVSAEQAALGFTTSTFSFNLPAPEGATSEVKAALAQRFVDLLCVHHAMFKPCVSFGQDNGLVYCTVPATSTQGAIKEEDKAKQAVGGVQLVRLSFPPTCDQMAVGAVLRDSIVAIYA